MVASRAGVVLGAALALASAHARAGEVAVVAGLRVAEPSCPIVPFSVAAFVDVLRVELADRTRAPGTILVALAVEPCDTSTTRVRVSVADDTGSLGPPQDVGLEDIAVEARPRALALAVAELVRSARPLVPPAAAATVAALPPSLRASPPVVGLAADALVSVFPSRDTTLWGGRVTFSIRRARWWLGVLGEAAAGERQFDVGRVAIQSFGAGLVAGPRWTTGRFTLGAGLAGALGWARIAGQAAAPDVAAGSGAALTAALRAHVDASLSLARGLSVRGLVEGGAMLRGLDATVDGAVDAGLSGATLVVGLGLGFGG
jgi:hypothetical protein